MKLRVSKAGSQHVDIVSNATEIWRIIGVTLAVLFLPLVIVSIAENEAGDFLGGSLNRHQERDRIASLSRIARLVWIVAIVLVPLGRWFCKRDCSAPRTLQRILFAGMIASPVVWLFYSIWLIPEILDVVY